MAATVKITGVRELERKLKRAGPLALTALAAAAVEEQERVMADAKDRVPVDLGTLKGSGTVLPPKIGAHQVEVVAGFGGAASAYAIVQHENLGLKHPGGGGPKFLESSFLEKVPGMGRALALGVERALQRLGA